MINTLSDYMQVLAHYRSHFGLISKNSKVIPKVLSGYIKTLLFRKTVLRTIEFTITPDCNLKCNMCYASKIKKKNLHILTPNEYAQIMASARKLGCFSVILSGGEPTLRSDLFDIIDALKPKKTMIALVTNSTRLDEQAIQKIKKSGITVIHFSLDHHNPQINDKIRTYPGHFKQVEKLIDLAKQIGLQVCISTVVFHNNFQSTKKLVEFAKRKNIGIVFSLACPSGRWSNSHQYLLTQDEWNTIDRYMHENPHIRSDWTINFSLKQECPSGREKICITPYGDVTGCGMNSISFGNIRKEPLEKIWTRTCNWSQFKRRSSKCLIAVDEEYLTEYLFPIADNNELPIPIWNHPKHPLKSAEISEVNE